MSITSFQDLYKQSTDFNQLNKQLKGKKKDYNDDRFWKATKDKAGNAQAVIRFLPTTKGDDLPFIEQYTHAFQGPGGQWMIENCPSTIGKPCPVCEANGKLWNSGIDSNKDVARKRKRVQKYISNILVIKDTANPSNEGKVFLFKYGAQIMSKITDAASPSFEGEVPVNAFGIRDGANFKLRISKKDKFDNYDKSTFDDPSELLDGDITKVEELWNKQYALKEFVADDQYKSYDELKKKLENVLGGTTQGSKSVEEDMETDNSLVETNNYNSTNESTAETLSSDTIDSEDMDAFRSLLE